MHHDKLRNAMLQKYLSGSITIRSRSLMKSQAVSQSITHMYQCRKVSRHWSLFWKRQNTLQSHRLLQVKLLTEGLTLGQGVELEITKQLPVSLWSCKIARALTSLSIRKGKLTVCVIRVIPKFDVIVWRGQGLVSFQVCLNFWWQGQDKA